MSKGETNYCRILPPEIIADVLSRLPVKSLCRFKCVSPSWNSLISSPHFSKTHLNRTQTNNPKHFLHSILLVLRSSLQDLYSVDLTAADLVPVAAKLDFPLLREPEYKWITVLNSCNGLVLVSDGGNSHLFLLNPATRECKKLPTPPLVPDPVRGYYKYAYGVGYDSSKDDYKVVKLSYFGSESESEYSTLTSDIIFVCVYSLETNAWRRIQDTHYVLDKTSSGTNCNGRLHWLCWRAGSHLVVAFDWADEIFREVPLPASFVYLDVVIIEDCLCLPYKQGSDPVEVWMMTEYGVRASWTKILIDTHDMYLQGLLAEDEFLLMGNVIQTNEDKLIVYNPKKETLRDIVVRGILAAFLTWGTYVESLVSPNQCSHGGGIGKQGYSQICSLTLHLLALLLSQKLFCIFVASVSFAWLGT